MSVVSFFVLSLIFFSCQKDTVNDFDDNTDDDPIGQVDMLYPAPPSAWVGGDDPVYTEGYVGDVMPFYDKGKFHIYFLHDALNKPAGKGFHDIHSFTTSDFTKYNYKGRDIPYGGSEDPDFALGTGAVVKADDNYYFFYTGHNGNDEFLKGNPRESVLMATSKDLNKWAVDKEFKLTAPAAYYDYEFRDPYVFYNEESNNYWMLVAAQDFKTRKAVLLKFVSDDLGSGNWEVKAPIYTTSDKESYIMLETPDLFKIKDYWYLLFSEDWSDKKGTHYRIANSPDGPWETPEHDRLDGEFFYAAKSVAKEGRRFLAGWTARRMPENNQGNKEWAGNLVVHELTQNENGTLALKMPEEVSHLYDEGDVPEVINSLGEITQDGSNFELPPNGQVEFAPLKNSDKLRFDLKSGASTIEGKAGIVFSKSSGDTGDAVRIELDFDNSTISAYIQREEGEEELVNQLGMELGGDTSHSLDLIVNEDVVVVYIDNTKAFSNRVYEAAGNNWRIYSKEEAFNFTNLKISSR